MDPTYAWPYHYLGLIDEQREKYETALSYLKQSLAIRQRAKEEKEQERFKLRVVAEANRLNVALQRLLKGSVLEISVRMVA